MTAQKETATILVKAGMTAEQSALYTSLIEYLGNNSAQLRGLIRLANESTDQEYRQHVVKSLLGRVSEIIQDNPELIKEITR